MNANVEVYYNNYTAVFGKVCPTEEYKRTGQCRKIGNFCSMLRKTGERYYG